MAIDGSLEDADVINFHQIDDRFETARHPLHQDKPGKHGVGLGLDFAFEVMRLNPTLAKGGIALVPCAWGGRYVLFRFVSVSDFQLLFTLLSISYDLVCRFQPTFTMGAGG